MKEWFQSDGKNASYAWIKWKERVLWGNCFEYHKIFYTACHAFVIHINEPYALLLVSEYFSFIPLMLVIV